MVWAHLPYKDLFFMLYEYVLSYESPDLCILQSTILYFKAQCCVKGKNQQIQKSLEEDFIYWFIGFAEGDGGFYYSESSNLKRFYFCIRQKNSKVLHFIQSTLNIGSIHCAGDGYYTYTVSARLEILIIFEIFNGRLLLAKTNNRFNNLWCANINKAFGVNYSYAGPASFQGFNNATLAGLTDSDGSFGISIQQNNTVNTTWTFDQSFEKPFLDNMRIQLGVGSVEPKILSASSFSNQGDAWRFKTRTLKDNLVLNAYFEKYPLHTEKAQIRYIHWKTTLEWQLQGPNVVYKKISAIREFQRINKLLT